MSELMDALIAQRKKQALDYQKYLDRIVDLAKNVVNPASGESYPKELNTPGKRALYDNLGKDEVLALTVDRSIRASRQDDWRNNQFKIKRVRLAIKAVLNNDDGLTTRTLELVKNQNEY